MNPVGAKIADHPLEKAFGRAMYAANVAAIEKKRLEPGHHIKTDAGVFTLFECQLPDGNGGHLPAAFFWQEIPSDVADKLIAKGSIKASF